MKRVKLSPPQSLFLIELYPDVIKYAVESYPPVRKLRALGFIEPHKGGWRITGDGKVWLTQYAGA